MMAVSAYVIYEPQFLPKSPPILDVVTPGEFQSKPDLSKEKTEIVKDILKGIFGYREKRPRHWLILNQDYLEARPTGGFPGTYMYITAQNGEIKDIEFDDIWNFDKPLKKAKKPQLNQSSWWAHFPTAAKNAIRVYQSETGKQVDGVMALDPTGIRYILEITGNVHVPEFKETVGAKNITDKILSYSPYVKNGQKEAKHKVFMAAIVQAMNKSLFGYDTFSKRNDIAQAFLKGLERKHILLYATDGETKKLLENNDWDGSLDSEPSADFLAIRDYNAGINKVDLYVRRDIVYQVDLNESPPIAKVTVDYEYKYDKALFSKYGEMAEPRFRDYKNIQRVYVPKGSKLLDSSGYDGFLEKTSEDGKIVFKGMIDLKPESKKTVHLTYKLPSEIKDEYKLLVRKQPGQPVFDNKPTKLRVDILSGKKHIEAYYPNFSTFDNGKVGFRLDLEYDKFIKLKFK